MQSRKALRNFFMWASLAIIVNILIYYFYGQENALKFFGGYIIELSLSVDNLFLFLMIFSSFGIPMKYQQRVLNYGVYGAIILRMIFIFLGLSIVERFHWLLYIFGIVLIISGVKVFIVKEDAKDFSKNKLLLVLRKIMPVTNQITNENFFVRINKKLFMTPLFLVLIVIETSDVIFALDSIPAIFSITTNPWIVYSSNIFAILGLRSLYFVLAKLNSMFKYIKYGVAFVLMFTGLKLFILMFQIAIPTVMSLLIILIILLFSILLSLLFE